MLFCSAIYRYALNAPGSTEIYPNTDSLMPPEKSEYSDNAVVADVQRFVQDIGHLVFEVLRGH